MKKDDIKRTDRGQDFTKESSDEDYTRVKNVIWFGTSLSKSLNCKKFERDSNTQVKLVKAYGIKGEEN